MTFLFFFWKPDDHILPFVYAIYCFLLSIMGAVIISGLFFIVFYSKNITPYLNKMKKYKSLLYLLVRRDFLAKYKRSLLGILWSLLNPLLTMVIMVIVFSYVFRFEIENFPVYVLSGQIIFNLFTEATTSAMGAIVGNNSLIKKVAVPKYIFPVSKVFTALINLAFSLLAFIIVMIITESPFHMSMIVMFLPIIYIFIFSLGVGLFLSAVLVMFRDINYLYSLLIFAVGYFTPIFYPLSIIPEKYIWFIKLNPLVYYVQCFRDAAIYGVFPSIYQHGLCLLIAFSSLFIGVFMFFRKQDTFIMYL